MFDLRNNYSLPNFNLHLQQTYRNLYTDKKFTDVTLVSDDQIQYPSHRFILSSSSSVFASILESLSASNPVIFLKGVSSEDLELLLKFIYHGEVNLPHHSTQRFLQIMEDFDTMKHINSKTVINEEQNVAFIDQKNVISSDISFLDSKTPKDEMYEDSGREAKSELEKKIKDCEVSRDSMKREKKRVNFSCNYCDHVTNRKGSLKQHIDAVHLNIKGSWPCDECNFVFTNKGSVTTHKKRVHEGFKIKCDYGDCDYQARSQQWLDHHKEIHGNNDLYCDQCEYKTIHDRNLKAHIKNNHSNHSYKCPHCDYKCKKRSSLSDHLKVKHEGKRIPCDQCDYMATRLDNLKSHIQSKHTMERFKCDKCDYSTIIERKFRSHKNKAH